MTVTQWTKFSRITLRLIHTSKSNGNGQRNLTVCVSKNLPSRFSESVVVETLR